MDLVAVDARLFCRLLIDAGGGDGHIEYLDDGAALGAGIPAVSAADVVRRDAPLLVGGARQGEEGVLPGDEVLHLYRIPHSVDVRRGGLHPVVHQDAALDPQLQPGRLGEAGVRRDADGQHHHVGGEGRLVLQQHIDPVTVGGKALHSAAQMQPHPFLPQLGVEEGGHVRVQGIQQLAGPLDHGDVDAQLPQVFHQLHADEAAAGQHRGPGMVLFDEFPDLQGVLYRAEGEQAVDPYAGQRRLGGPGTGGEDQFVIGFGKGLAGSEIPHVHGLLCRVDGCDFVAHPHVHPEAPPEALRRLERQLLFVGDDAADVIGQTTVGVGYISGPLKYHDFRGLVQPAEPGRGGGASGHAAYNDDFHLT